MNPELESLYQEISQIAENSPIDALIIKWKRILDALNEAANKMMLAPTYCLQHCKPDCPIWNLQQYRCCQDADIVRDAYHIFIDKVETHLYKLRQKREQLAEKTLAASPGGLWAKS